MWGLVKVGKSLKLSYSGTFGL